MDDFKVIVTNVENIEDNYYLLKTLGRLFNKEEKRNVLISKFMIF